MSIRNAAIGLLARREHSRRELTRKLTQRGFDATAISQVLFTLEQESLLSESRFIGMIVRVRSSKGLGPLRIIAELQTHGISQRDIEQNEDWQATDWIYVGCVARAKRFTEKQPNDTTPLGLEEKIKQTRYLIQRGFQVDQVREILKTDNMAEPSKSFNKISNDQDIL